MNETTATKPIPILYAVSANSKKGIVTEHRYTFKGKRLIEKIFWNRQLKKLSP